MNNQDFSRVVETTLDGCRQLMVSKGGEYAGPEDRLGNFKRGAALTGTSAYQVCFIYLSKHYDAVANYVRECARLGAPPALSEPIEGRLDDLLNYCILLKALIVESNAWIEETAKQEAHLREVEGAGQPVAAPEPPADVLRKLSPEVLNRLLQDNNLLKSFDNPTPPAKR